MEKVVLEGDDENNMTENSNLKTNSISNGIKNRICNMNISTKRYGPKNKLLVEEFCFDVYKRNQAGFITSRPGKWVEATKHTVQVTKSNMYGKKKQIMMEMSSNI